jgi:AmmeMemoRadiSam system protein A
MEGNWIPLSWAERRDLLHLARESIGVALRGDAPPCLATPTPSLLRPCGAFVSLHLHGDLRGCVGTLTAEHPLHESVARLAVAAAFDDPRFLPLTDAELAHVLIEISRLSPPMPTSAGEIVVGHHGVCMVFQERRAVFLPQVAELYSWDRERLLDELCRKAHLPANMWRHPACELFCFEAEVFGEGNLATADEL